MKQNCWEFYQCSNIPDSKTKSDKNSVCPVTVAFEYNGINYGTGAGRFCWVVKCAEMTYGKAEQFKECMKCPFFAKVVEEEGRFFRMGP